MVALLLAILKAVPAAEGLFKDALSAYAAYRLSQNDADETKNALRDDAAVAAALARLPKQLCASCPFAAPAGAGHGGAVPPVA